MKLEVVVLPVSDVDRAKGLGTGLTAAAPGSAQVRYLIGFY